ncbi:Bacterial SH3 domain, partial [endosymbiont of Ridgeia piscesae]
LHYIFPFLITLFFYRSHGKQYTLPILSERLIQVGSSVVDEHLNGILQLPWIGDKLRVKVKRANLRAGPGTGNEIVETVTEGSELVEIGHHGNWSYIINPDTKKRGWIADWLTVRTTP